MTKTLTDDDLEIIKEEKEFEKAMKNLNKFFNCSCGYKAQGKGLKSKQEDMINHVKNKHLERRPFSL